MAEQPENQQPDQPVPQPRVAAVSVKLPPFWPADPAIWFLQVEAQFSLKGIVQQRTRFDHVIAVLAPEVATEVRDLIINPPADTPYDLLKAALIKRTEASEQRRLQQLLTAEELETANRPSCCDVCNSCWATLALRPTVPSLDSCSYNACHHQSAWS